MLRIRATITIKDPAEFNAYQMFSTQTDPKAEGRGRGELPEDVSAERGEERCSGPDDRRLSAGWRLGRSAERREPLLQVDPNNLKAILYFGLIKKGSAEHRRLGSSADLR